MTYPSVYPTGTTVYKPEKCWNGYTLFQAAETGALLVDMNGNGVQLWEGLHGFPNKLLPGGYVFGSTGVRPPAHAVQDQLDLVQVDWDGKITWKFDKHEYIEDPGEEPRWMARQHHDFQRTGNPTGYYVPGMIPEVDKGNTLILCHRTVTNPKISEKRLIDDTIIEVDWEGNIVWEWNCHEHFDDYGFDEASKNILYRDPNYRPAGGGMGDWMHINSMSVLGPNKWYDAGDERFHPDNIIWDSREANIAAIISKETGKVVWKIGPYYDTPELKEFGWLVGMHHCHMIPRGLPGEGNIMIFDNGGWAGYGLPNPLAPKGVKNALRDYSRVVEFDPTTMKIVWQYTPKEAGFEMPYDSNRFYSPFISGAQRLPNGNTLICEGSGGRLIEVTSEHEIVWEYISPYFGKQMRMNMVYRAYRYPYDWVPQLAKPNEVPIVPVDVTTFRMPGAGAFEPVKSTKVPGVEPYKNDPAVLCVGSVDEQ